MRLPLGLALVLALSANASAQAPSPLATALAARYPTHELVPQSCAPGPEPLVAVAGRICLRDEPTGLVRVVRRVALVEGGAGATVARSGSDVLFAVGDSASEYSDGVSTRLGGRVWRWDLTRDAYIGLANATYEGGAFATTFGLFYWAGDGLHRWAPSGATRVTWADPGGRESSQVVVVGDTTYVLRHGMDETSVATLTAAGEAITETPVATLRGELILASRGVVITSLRSRERPALHVLRLPATTPTEIPLEPGTPAPNGATWVDADTVRLPRWRMSTLRLALATSALTEEAAPPTPPVTLAASSLRTITPTASGLVVSSSRGGFTLDAHGAARTRRTSRTARRSRCSCEAAALVCPGGARIEDACTEVPELDYVAGSSTTRSTLYSPDGALRIDRLEVDLVRVTRLRDGARLWVRILGNALLAQLDDGTYFLSDRSLEPMLALRDGGSLAAGPLAPLTTRADALYRPTLVAEFFSAP